MATAVDTLALDARTSAHSSDSPSCSHAMHSACEKQSSLHCSTLATER